MLASRVLSKRGKRKRTQSKNSQKALSLIADEKQKGHLTNAQAEALERLAVSMYLSAHLQIAVEETQHRLGGKLNDLVEQLSRLEWE